MVVHFETSYLTKKFPKNDDRRSVCASQLAAAKNHLVAKLRQREVPALNIIEDQEEITKAQESIRYSQNFSTLIVLGIGGSSLGGQALCQLHGKDYLDKKVIFVETLDPTYIKKVLDTVTCSTTGVVVISKSGNTLETVAQALVFLAHWEQKVGRASLKKHFIFLSSKSKNVCRALAEIYRCPCLELKESIPGRFSIFSSVALVPALFVGANIGRLYQGALAKQRNFIDQAQEDVADSLKEILYLLSAQGITQHVLFSYGECLAPLNLWFRQLLAESLGKDGKGLTALHAFGPADQHSQLQLFLDGPKDKVVTMLDVVNLGTHISVQGPEALEAIEDLRGKTLEELMAVQAQATYESLIFHGVPVRRVRLSSFDAFDIGYLVMHLMLEVILLGSLLHINPWDQSAVEDGKKRARRLLTVF